MLDLKHRFQAQTLIPDGSSRPSLEDFTVSTLYLYYRLSSWNASAEVLQLEIKKRVVLS